MNNHNNIVFEEAPISLWEEDFSLVKEYIESLKKKGVTDFKTYFDENPKALEKCFEKILIIDINKTTLKLYEASTKEELIKGLAKTFTPESFETFEKALINLIKGKKSFSAESKTQTLKGNENIIHLRWSLPSQYKKTWARVLVSMEDITQRKMNEITRKESEEKFSKAFQTSLDLIAINSVEKGTIIDVNKSFLKVLGYKRKEVINRTSDELKMWINEDARKRIIQLVSEKGFCKDVEVKARKKNGDILFGLFSAVQVHLSEGPVILSMMKDITERKIAEDILKIQRDLILASNECSTLKELMQVILNAALRIEGIDAGGVYSMDPETMQMDLIVHQGLPDEFIKMATHYEGDSQQAKLVAKGNPIHGHYDKLKLPLKEEGLKALSIIPIKHEYNVVGALNLASHTHDKFSKAIQDSFESLAAIVGGQICQSSAEAALLESEERYKTVVNLSPDAIAILQDGLFKFVNPAAIKLLGYPKKDLDRGLNFFSIVSEDDKQEVIGTYEKNVKREMTPSSLNEINIVTKTGYIVTIETTIIPIQHDGRPAILVNMRDLSERKKHEKEKKELEERIQQSEKMQAIGRLAGGIAHDFNNQLAGIVGYADLLREKLSENKDLAFYADNILLASKRAADLTSQLLAFARKGKYISVPVDIHKTILEVVTLLQHSIDKRIIIKQQLNANPPLTPGDPTQLQNVLLNIALNARDAMPNGGEIIFTTEVVSLDKKFCEQSPFDVFPGKFILVDITDSGIGMDEKILKKIFEPFFTTKQTGRGTGMGLAAVYGAIKNHKGAINVFSKTNKGSTFKIFLPLDQKIYDIIEEASEPGTISGSANILLVDDEDIVCKVATKMLEVLGYKVIVCKNGLEAINEYKKSWQHIDLVILDMIMPEMNGRDTFIEMKKINPKISALLSSGYSMDDDTKEIFQQGIKGFIQKPYNKSEISQKIADVLKP
ncbi:PAS domain S-box protein [Spirochaetota bacterium]